MKEQTRVLVCTHFKSDNIAFSLPLTWIDLFDMFSSVSDLESLISLLYVKSAAETEKAIENANLKKSEIYRNGTLNSNLDDS